ncbi:predicted protein [Sclerotinia sclerotiorum 1980 UF-70]|uniref:Uncharacterized protein n=1 Tax=Sclerotinia sclerotiorum (strain ATCC 18683 / 1980 / Ss-1) TaxID=665079 RepID=A7F826_SCLS1|nr:predicted protein [Sclerotinia sclerotiorum 1980 UF-70]EDN98897.1 predicted protein [Sclerotinia sclerotiorum 1980 UF-70]
MSRIKSRRFGDMFPVGDLRNASTLLPRSPFSRVRENPMAGHNDATFEFPIKSMMAESKEPCMAFDIQHSRN